MGGAGAGRVALEAGAESSRSLSLMYCDRAYSERGIDLAGNTQATQRPLGFVDNHPQFFEEADACR